MDLTPQLHAGVHTESLSFPACKAAFVMPLQVVRPGRHIVSKHRTNGSSEDTAPNSAHSGQSDRTSGTIEIPQG